MITAAQMRAARGLLNWSQRDLAERSGVALSSIKRIELDDGSDPRTSTLQKLRETLESEGVVFLANGDTKAGGPGVRLCGVP